MTPALEITLLWIGFGGTHLLLSSQTLRPRIAGALGAQAFQGVYSLVAFAFFVPLVWIYFGNIHSGAWLWTLPRGPVLTWIVQIGMGLAFVMLVSGAMAPSPASVVPGSAEVRGMYRITRHPVVMGLGLFGLLHLLPNASTSDVAFFGGFVLFALLGARHQDQRKLANGPEGFGEFHAGTPFLPFTGRGTLRALRELSPIAVGIGIVLAIAVRYAHALWT